MAKKNWLMDNMMVMPGEKRPHTVIDLGYFGAASARKRADKLAKVIGKGNFGIFGHNRLLAYIPPTKLSDVLSQFPEVKGEASYMCATHSWVTEDAKDLKYARGAFDK